MPRRPIGEWLVRRGVVRAADVERAAEMARGNGIRLLSQLVRLNLVTEAQAVEALSSELGFPGIDLSRSAINLEHLGLIPREIAELEHVLPIAVANDRLVLAMVDPHNEHTAEAMQVISGLAILPHVALAEQLDKVIRGAYDRHADGQRLWGGTALPRQQKSEVLAIQVPRTAPDSADDVVIEVEDSEGNEIVIDDQDGSDGIEEELAAVSARPHGRLILVVDDDEEILTLVTRMLEKKGYRVEKARKGSEVLEKVAQHLPDLVLLDANLPEVHGFDICRKLKASPKYSRIPVLIMTAVFRGWRFAHDSRESFGASDYIEKPFRMDDLLRRVEHHLSAAIGEPSREKEKAEKLYQEGVKVLEGGDPAKAATILQKAVDADAFNPRAFYQLGRALQAAGDGYRAIGAYERSVDLRPDHFPTLRSLAALYQQKGFRRKAIEAWERAIPAAPDEATRQKIKNSLMAIL